MTVKEAKDILKFYMRDITRYTLFYEALTLAIEVLAEKEKSSVKE